MTIGRQVRRRFLQSRLAAPALAGLSGSLRAFGKECDPLIASADQAVDVFDFEGVGRAKLPPAHFGYLATGVDGDATLRANSGAFAHYQLRVRRLLDLSRIDTSVDLYGTTWDTPIYLNSVSSQRAVTEIINDTLRPVCDFHWSGGDTPGWTRPASMPGSCSRSCRLPLPGLGACRALERRPVDAGLRSLSGRDARRQPTLAGVRRSIIASQQATGGSTGENR